MQAGRSSHVDAGISRSPLRRLAPVLLALIVTSPAPAAEGEAAPARAERFGDWEIVCEPAKAPPTDGGGPSRDCRALQRQVAQKTGQSVFLATVLPAGRGGGLVAILSTPLGGYLAPGMILTPPARPSISRGRSSSRSTAP